MFQEFGLHHDFVEKIGQRYILDLLTLGGIYRQRGRDARKEDV